MNLLLLGHGGHGKDTAAGIISEQLGIDFESSSWAACKYAVYPYLKDKYGYTSIEECFNDRRNHRGEWRQLIWKYNEDEPTRLARMVLSRSSMYVGMRDPREYQACIDEDLFDFVLTVDARQRKPLEGPESLEIEVFKEADWILDNNVEEDAEQAGSHLREEVDKVLPILHHLQLSYLGRTSS